jgi:2,3-bisphosphoglycerate-independent phosphoglycerate mutase
MKSPLVLIIRDGWGISPNGPAAATREGNATLLANTPFHNHLYATYPMSRLSGSGEDVGLPAGQMGNSEVGHLNLGAGRIVYQDLTRINLAIRDGSFARNPILGDLLTRLRTGGRTLHLVGLVSDGGVHSHQDHILAIVEAARDQGVERILIHAITDGRDTSPTGGLDYLKRLEDGLSVLKAGRIATVCGRYYAMDRDQRWERTQLAYDLIMDGKGTPFPTAAAALQASYDAGITDEFVQPAVLPGLPTPLVADGDGVLFFNFRADRVRQLSRAWLEKDFDGFPRSRAVRIDYVTLTQYDAKYTAMGVPCLFPPQSMKNILGEVLAAHGKTQCRLAETEKYPHVTYFFNGGHETPFPGEDREVIPSPKVATYDLQPEMSAKEVTAAVLRRLETRSYDAIIVNFANPDMVGHTGVLAAAIRSVETIDDCVRQVVEKTLELGGRCLITADHGNCEQMLTPEGKPHTAHTTNLVHFIYAGADHSGVRMLDGILADVAPTMLDLLGIPRPAEMTGQSRIVRSKG